MIRIAELADIILKPAGSRRSNAPAGEARARAPVAGPASTLFVSLEAHQPLRPRVELVGEAESQRMAGARQIDLSETPFLYIVGAAGDGE